MWAEGKVAGWELFPLPTATGSLDFPFLNNDNVGYTILSRTGGTVATCWATELEVAGWDRGRGGWQRAAGKRCVRHCASEVLGAR